MASLKHIVILSLLAIIALSTLAEAATYSEIMLRAQNQTSERRLTGTQASPRTSFAFSPRTVQRATEYSQSISSLRDVSSSASRARQSDRDLSRAPSLRQPQRVLGDYSNTGLARRGYTSEASSRFRSSTPGQDYPTGQSSTYGTGLASTQRVLGSYQFSTYGQSSRRFIGSTATASTSTNRAPTVADRIRQSGSYFMH